jgi:hypothetical protein
MKFSYREATVTTLPGFPGDTYFMAIPLSERAIRAVRQARRRAGSPITK